MEVVKWFIHCILFPREYYEKDGELYVREWFSEPMELMKHLREVHHMNQAEINDFMLEARRMLNNARE